MKKVIELLLSLEHFKNFLEANVEDEGQAIQEERQEEVKVEEPIQEEPVEEKTVKEEPVEEVNEPVQAETTSPVVESTGVILEEKPVDPIPLVIEDKKPFKPTSYMNYRELREYYKKLRGKK